MGLSEFEKEIASLLESGRELTAADFLAACPGASAASVYSRIRALRMRGVLSQTGRGRYRAVRKPGYAVPVTDWMREVNEYLIDCCEGVNLCISQCGENLLVEAARADLLRVESCLKARYEKVVRKKDADRFPARLDGYVLVGVLVSDAPVVRSGGCPVPSLEKILVDSLCREANGTEMPDFQRAMEVFPVNPDRMHRYAARRGVSEELEHRLQGLDTDRIELFSRIQRFFSRSDLVSRAWVFGSFARGEETAESDLDLLVDFDSERNVSLLDILRQKRELEKLIGREVDIVENGYLKPFAIPSAERDKYLIYAR